MRSESPKNVKMRVRLRHGHRWELTALPDPFAQFFLRKKECRREKRERKGRRGKEKRQKGEERGRCNLGKVASFRRLLFLRSV